jgi:hypothetical protein
MPRKRARKAKKGGYMIVVSEIRVKDICSEPGFHPGKVYRKKSTAQRVLKKRNAGFKRRGMDIGDKIIKWPPKCKRWRLG